MDAGHNGQQIPAHTHAGTTGFDDADHTHTYAQPATGNVGGGGVGTLQSVVTGTTTGTTTGRSAQHHHPFTTDNGTGGGQAHPNVQPTGITNWIIKT